MRIASIPTVFDASLAPPGKAVGELTSSLLGPSDHRAHEQLWQPHHCLCVHPNSAHTKAH